MRQGLLMPRVRRLAILVLALAAIETLGVCADLRWSFRSRLLSAFAAVARIESSTDATWGDPDQLFQPSYSGYSQKLLFRRVGSPNPTGEDLTPADLPEGRRVFVLGESAAFGVGCRSEETFAALLDASQTPRGMRVLNAGQVGANPWQVLDAGAQLLKSYAPSALVVFTGNNLWIDWKPPQQQGWNPRVIAALETLATSRAVAGLEFLLIRGTLLHLRPPSAAFQDHYERSGSQYALQHPLDESAAFPATAWEEVKRQHLQRFETTLELLTKQARERRVRVVLVTMPFNYRLSPAWKHPQFAAYDPNHSDEVRRLVAQAGRLVQAGEYARALPITDQALALDPQPPVLHYLRAQSLEQLGRLDEAEAAYAQSREQMIGNLGSRLSVNRVIRSVAARHDVPLVDAAQIFDDYEHAHGRHFNEDLILDDCHPTPQGHRLIAEALVPML